MNPFTIGREPHNSLVPEDTLCSRNHARIERTIEAGITQYQLIDIGSSNGTYLDQQRIAPHQPMLLQPNSLIRIGNEEWRFDLGDEGSNP
jgi:pSer/pThr/pTyr-binding forkhead associated (FHA) protein